MLSDLLCNYTELIVVLYTSPSNGAFCASRAPTVLMVVWLILFRALGALLGSPLLRAGVSRPTALHDCFACFMSHTLTSPARAAVQISQLISHLVCATSFKAIHALGLSGRSLLHDAPVHSIPPIIQILSLSRHTKVVQIYMLPRIHTKHRHNIRASWW